MRGTDFDGRPAGATAGTSRSASRVELAALPLPSLPGPIQVANAATALMALHLLRDRLPLTREAIVRGLQSVRLPGRFQRVPDARGFEWVLDVAHNPAAAATLAANLRALPVTGRTLAVCGMLGDKDVPAVVGTLRESVDQWFAASPKARVRSMPSSSSAGQGPRASTCCRQARCPRPCNAPPRLARPGDRIVVFGSFHTVGPALAALRIPL